MLPVTSNNVFSALVLFIIMSSAMVGCKQSTQKSIDSPGTIISLDTAIIHQKYAAYDSISPADTINRKRVWRSLLSKVIETGYTDKACVLLMDMGRHFADRGNFDSSLHYYNRAREYCFKPLYDKTLPAAYLSEFGAFYHSLRSDYVAANASYYQALQYLKENNLTDNVLTMGLYIYLFYTQEELGNAEQALVYLKEAELLAKKLNLTHALISVRTNLGNYYTERKAFDTARKYYNQALEIVPDPWNPAWDPNILQAALVGKASIHTKTGEAEKAIPLLTKAIKVAQENNIIYGEVVGNIELGSAYNQLGRYRDATETVTKALEAQKHFSWYREEGYRVLMQAYEHLGDYPQALNYQRKLYNFNDSVRNNEKIIELNALDKKYQSANKDKEIASKALEIAQQKNNLQRKNSMIAGISVAAVLVCLFLFILYKTTAHKHKIRALEIKTLRRQQEIELLRSVMQGEEQERQRLARELHDGIGSMLSSAIMRFSLLKQHNHDKAHADVLKLLQETGTEVRRTAQNMMPDTIYKQSISQAVKTYCEGVTLGTNLEIDVQFYGITGNFSPYCKLVIYRIIQELVHNIVKHANATKTIVQGVMNNGRFSITVEDDGNGFDTTSDKKGMGLKNVESRVKSLYGDLQIESSPGRGTTVYIEFDCKQLVEEEMD